MSIAENLERVTASVREAELKAGRKPGSVELLAVSKFNPAESVLAALRAGQCLFGENRVQEAREKFEGLRRDNPALRLHLIGTLQRNKVRHILPMVECVQSVDRVELLSEIGKRAAETKKSVDVLFEFHTGEQSKAGFPDETSLLKAIDLLAGMEYVRCRGLMTMAPWSTDEKAVRASFRALAAMGESCSRRYPNLDFSTLSMGMSGDYRIAIEEGSTLIRIGTAIFGERT